MGELHLDGSSHSARRRARAGVMTDSRFRSRHEDGESVFALAAQVARRASDGQLVLAAAIGIIAAALVVLVRPSLWFLALPLLSIGSVGAWGIAERTATERAARFGPGFAGHRILATIRLTSAVVATLCGLLTLLVTVAQIVGTWQS